MRGQDRQRLIGGIDEQHQQVVERRVLLARSRHPPLVAVAQRRLVAMVAVGDRHRTAGHGLKERRDRSRRVAIGGDRPEPVVDPVVVGHLPVRGAGRERVQDRPADPVGIVVEPDDRARVDARRPQQLVAVFPGRLHRPLVREHAGAGSEGFEPKPSEEPALRADDLGPRDAIFLLVDVDRGVRILVECPIGAPAGERPGGPPVAVVGLITGLLGRQVDTDDVGRVAGEQSFALGRTDDVVWRRHDERRVGDGRGVVAKSAEGTALGHGTSGQRRAGRQISGRSHRTIAAARAPDDDRC
jgi:hypothetical protein